MLLKVLYKNLDPLPNIQFNKYYLSKLVLFPNFTRHPDLIINVSDEFII